MSLIKIKNLTFAYYENADKVFNDVSFVFDTNWKIGLIGRNGIGKSTLFKLLLNEEEYLGKIIKSVDCVRFPPNNINKELTGIELFNYYVNDERWKLIKELNILKVNKEVLNRPFKTLSNGEQTKILLAIFFTNDDGFLLIDEPTNHLDLEGRKVVSEYLKHKTGFMLISHDRQFLDNCIDHVISINRNSIDIQNGNFTTWEENKKKKDQFEINKNDKLKKELKHLKLAAQQYTNWSNKIEKTKNGIKVSGIKPDKGNIGHQSAKMMKKVSNLKKRQNKMIEEKQSLLKDVELKENLILHSLNSNKEVLVSVKNLSVYYSDKLVLDNLSFEIKQGEKVAVCGNNGSGKTTLLKVLMKQKQDYYGEVKFASDMKISYIAQDTSYLTGMLDDYIRLENVDEVLCKAILRKLNFSRTLFNLKMENYSDGQKKKVLLAISLSKQAHIFIWDEPLNYLDVISRIQLEEMLLNSNVTLVFVEHDQNFINKVSTKIINI